ncbi:MAG: DUF1080 domain-containing protein, partial [Anaerolineae bacterium]|nr:DUF1080 domain-containing protein [Anaerolineae bacterium]
VDPAIWKLRNESGRGMVLEGTGTGSSRLDAPAIILADTTADWKRSADFVMRFSFNIEANSDSVGARVIYRSSEAGYNVLEFLRGTVILRRSGNDVGQRLLSRDQEPVVRRRSNIHLDGNTWHDVVIWVQSDRLDIYLDGVPLTPIEDISPEFHAGQIMLQVIGNRPVAFDDLTIDRIDEAATHFEDDSIPESWTGNAARFEGESDGNRYLLLRGAASITTASTWGDFEAECRIWDVEGSYRIRLRQSEAGAVALDYNIFGTLIVSRLDGDDMPVWDGLPVANFHGRSNWVNLRLIFRGDQLRIYANGVQAFSATIPDAPPAGAVVFETTAPRDNLRVDDCIFLNSAP